MDKLKMPTFDMSGKTVLITGATTGIGYATALTFANFGADIVITSRKQADCDRVKGEIEAMGVRCLALRADSSSLEDIESLIGKTMETFGKIDVLVNNAGVGGPLAGIADTTEEEWDYIHGINLKGVYMLSKRAAQKMIDRGEGGRIIIVSSASGISGSKMHSVYGASKGGVSALGKHMANELGRYNITVNSVCPNHTLTEILSEFIKDPEIKKSVEGACPMHKYGEPEDVAAAIIFLASDAAGYITGTDVVIDGGKCVGAI